MFGVRFNEVLSFLGVIIEIYLKTDAFLWGQELCAATIPPFLKHVRNVVVAIL